MKTYSIDGRFRESLARVRTLTASPNVLYVVLDGLSFDALEPFGGLIETPTLTRLAQRGLRYPNFHASSLGSPAPLAALLRPHGYVSIALATDVSALGFDRAYEREECASLEALATKAIECLSMQGAAEPDRPWLCYLAFGGQSTQPVARPWIEKYRGRFDYGWDDYESQVLERQCELGLTRAHRESASRVEWTALDAAQRAAEAREMELFAARVSHTDAQLGRVLNCLERTGQLEHTLLFAVACGTAPARWQRGCDRSAERSPLIVHWPRGIRAQNEWRKQPHAWADLLPTILAAAGVEAQLAGAPMNDSFDAELTLPA